MLGMEARLWHLLGMRSSPELCPGPFLSMLGHDVDVYRLSQLSLQEDGGGDVFKSITGTNEETGCLVITEL